MTRQWTNIHDDGWALLSAEERHAASPSTFVIPSFEVRDALRRGDAAKLLFDIETRDGGVVIDRGVDRMWVVVTGRAGSLYSGVLISDPGRAEGLELRPGSELVFLPVHICAVERPPDEFLRERFGADFLSGE
jgi:hypothetical protein